MLAGRVMVSIVSVTYPKSKSKADIFDYIETICRTAGKCLGNRGLFILQLRRLWMRHAGKGARLRAQKFLIAKAVAVQARRFGNG